MSWFCYIWFCHTARSSMQVFISSLEQRLVSRKIQLIDVGERLYTPDGFPIHEFLPQDKVASGCRQQCPTVWSLLILILIMGGWRGSGEG